MPTSARASCPEPADTPRDSNLWRHAREEQAIQSCIESGRAEGCCSRFGGRFVGQLTTLMFRCAVPDQQWWFRMRTVLAIGTTSERESDASEEPM
jgi:hypothetical protein